MLNNDAKPTMLSNLTFRSCSWALDQSAVLLPPTSSPWPNGRQPVYDISLGIFKCIYGYIPQVINMLNAVQESSPVNVVQVLERVIVSITSFTDQR